MRLRKPGPQTAPMPRKARILAQKEYSLKHCADMLQDCAEGLERLYLIARGAPVRTQHGDHKGNRRKKK
jgi:hypothetical protein